ncbi:MAG: T9SS type A sorting domain-containing protein [Saprospiraceae bacterium]
MKKQFVLCVILFFSCFKLQAQAVNWLKFTGGSGDDFSSNFAIDGMNNIYLSGAFSGAVDFDFGSGTHILESDNFIDNYMLKVDANGNFQWVKSLGVYVISVPSITTDQNENIIVEDYVPNDEGLTNARLKKFLPNGNVLFEQELDWYGYVGIYQPDKIKSEIVVIDADSSLYTINSDRDDIVVIFDENGNTVSQNYSNYDDLGFISFGPYDELGDEIWYIGTLYGSVVLEWGQSIPIGEGDFYEDIDYRVSNILVKSDRSGNLLDAKIINNGSLQDQTSFIYSCFPRVAKVDSMGNLYVLARSVGNVEYGTGSNTVTLNHGIQGGTVIQKFSSDGELVWVKDIDTPSSGTLSSFDITDDNQLIFSGVFTGVMDVDPNDDNEVYLQSDNPVVQNLFLVKLDEDGQFIWAEKYPVSGGAVRSAGNEKLIVTGVFKDDFSINTIQDGSIDVSNAGLTDIYLMEILDGTMGTAVKDAQMQPCQVYPNILKNGESLHLACTNNFNSTVRIFNSVGRLLQTFQSTNNTIEISNSTPGVYYLQIEQNNTLYSAKFIVVN